MRKLENFAIFGPWRLQFWPWTRVSLNGGPSNISFSFIYCTCDYFNILVPNQTLFGTFGNVVKFILRCIQTSKTPCVAMYERARKSLFWCGFRDIPYEADQKMTILTLTPFDFHETLWAFIRPWVKRNVTIFCRRTAFRFRDVRHQTLVLRGHTTILKAS